MRVIGAGIFVFGGLLLIVGLLGSQGLLDGAPTALVGVALALVMLTSIGVALWLFNPRGTDPLGATSPEEHLRKLEELNLLDTQTFQATRAFGVEEFEDEGLHYFLELTDGRVLFLSGQYLYNYEAISDDPEMNQPRSFPCTEFTVRRHKKEGYVADLRCRGRVLDPEVMAPTFGEKVWDESNGIPEDGQLFSDVGYDELKRRYTSTSG